MESQLKHAYLERVVPKSEMPCGLFAPMLGIWHHSPYLLRRFPLHRGNPDDYWRFVAWCSDVGIHDRKILRQIPEWDEDLGDRAILPHLEDDLWDGGYSMKMHLHSLHMAGGKKETFHFNAGYRHLISVDYWRGTRHRLHAPSPQAWQVEWLCHQFKTPERFAETLRIPSIDGQKDVESLMEDFAMGDILQAWGRVAQKDPSLDHDSHSRIEAKTYRYQWVKRVRRMRELVLPWLVGRRPSEQELTSVMRGVSLSRQTPQIRYPFGVNLFGYAKGELGIGEDVRMAARALEANGIPSCIVNVSLGKHISQMDDSAENRVSPQPLYGINLFCQTGIEMVRYANTEGMESFDGRYTIGLWPWELPEWPESCRHAYALVDEIWGISSHVAQAYRSFGGEVKTMGLPVEVSTSTSMGRKDFGLPSSPYLFHFSFDLHSRIQRKNPLGIIKAFQMAFPKESHREVGLVIKVNHPETFSWMWKKIRLLARFDSRIHIVERRMRRPEVLDLMRACDCYVSLHRAEGFGRGIAEAILLGKQVIATGWSGNMDFCHEPRVALVRHRMVPLKRGEYFHGEGQEWAEPYLNHASELMREVWQNPRDISVSQPDLSPATVGGTYAKRLNEIWERFATPQAN
jgi:hypothetical protein